MESTMVSKPHLNLPKAIFRAYDIRGIAGDTLTPEIMYLLGQCVGTEVALNNKHALVFGRDGRLSGPAFAEAFCQGVNAAGVDIIDIGIVPTPLVYFGAHHLKTGNAVMLTGSHNPGHYNGLKMMIGGETLAEQRIQALATRVEAQDFLQGKGNITQKDILADYIKEIAHSIKLQAPLKVVVDAGNGVGGVTAVPLLKQLGCETIPLYCEVDGHFPNHHPDPSKPENLATLIQTVQAASADLGIAFDGDGDRLGVVTPQGHILWPDKLMMLFSKDLLSRHPGATILYDVKCSRHLTQVITAAGGQPVMCRTGHSLIKQAMKTHHGLLAGEMSGHFFFKEDWYGFDDACLAAVKLIAMLTADLSVDLDAHCQPLPKSEATPEINIAVPEAEKFALVEALKAHPIFSTGFEKIVIDGLRVENETAWGLVRASNTTPNLVLRFEAESQAGLKAMQATFKTALLAIQPGLTIPF